MSRKNLLEILFIGFICLSFTQATYNRVKFVYDGDTILLETGDKAGYRGISFPEPEQIRGRRLHQGRRAGVWWTILE